MDPIDRQALAAVIEFDPGGAARRVLAIAMKHAGAERAALHAVDGDTLALFASHAVDQQDLDLVPAAWDTHRARLDRGEVVTDSRWTVAAVGRPASALVYFGGLHPPPAPLVRQILSRLGPFFEDAVRAKTNGRAERAREAWVQNTRVDDFEKEQLEILLDRNEWNVARVARILHVCRRTMYQKIRKYGLQRPGGFRPAPANSHVDAES